MNHAATVQRKTDLHLRRTLTKQAKVALICDLLEENWPSMDLVADMLYCQLASHHSSTLQVAQLRPPMRRRFTRIPVIGGSDIAHNADRLFNRFIDYPRWMRKRTDKFDLFHIIDHSYAQLARELPAGRTIITCHDLDAFRCLLEPAREARPLWFRAFSRRILDGLGRAIRVICGSRVIHDEILTHKLISPERLRVVYYGVHPALSPVPDSNADHTVSRLLQKLGPGPLILNVGLPVPRKRLDVLLHVFARVRQRFPKAGLIRVGGPLRESEARLATQLGLEPAIVSLPFLERSELGAVYRRAALLLQTSEAEGFGLPLIEAMGCGCPVVATDLPVLQEVGGAAVAFCPLADLPGWTDTVSGLLHEREHNVVEWELRRQRALRRAAQFSWTSTASQMSDIYQEVLQIQDGLIE